MLDKLLLALILILSSCAKDGKKKEDTTKATVTSSETCKIDTTPTAPTESTPEVIVVESEPETIIVEKEVEVCSSSPEEIPTDLTSISDSELLAELESRGLLPEEDTEDTEEKDSEGEEKQEATINYSRTICNNLPLVDIVGKSKKKSYFVIYQNKLYQVTNRWSTIWETYSLETGKLTAKCQVQLGKKGVINVQYP